MLATVTRLLPDHGGTVVIDSAEWVAEIPELDGREFCGSLFVHAIGAKGHDVIKYALDIYGERPEKLSCTHDSNPFPADYYGGLPAPMAGEKVCLWLQNCHPTPIPSGTIRLNRMGESDSRPIPAAMAGFATLAVDLAEIFPDAQWPEQYELHAKKHFGRPRYEVTTSNQHQYIAHINIERDDLAPNDRLAELSPRGGKRSLLGKGYLLPAPILPLGDFSSLILPTPMSRRTESLPLGLAIYGRDGRELARNRSVTCRATMGDSSMPRNCCDRQESQPATMAIANSSMTSNPAGPSMAGSTPCFASNDTAPIGKGQCADTSFGAHIYNIPYTFGKEPQSYIGAPPGLSTRLFLRVDGRRDRATGELINDTICHLIYPSSAGMWHPQSTTRLLLCNPAGATVAERTLQIPQSGSFFFTVQTLFSTAEVEHATAQPKVPVPAANPHCWCATRLHDCSASTAS